MNTVCHPHHLLRFLTLSIWALVGVAVAIAPPPSFAQAIDRAPVTLDGRELFRISSSGNFSAEERADIVNAALAQVVRERGELDLNIDAEDGPLTVRAGEHHLITVTDADVVPSMTGPHRQAEAWRAQFERALQRAQQERSPSYRQRAAVASVGVVGAVLVLHLAFGFLRGQMPRVFSRWRTRPETFLHDWEQPIRGAIVALFYLLQVSMWIGAAYWICDRFPNLRSWRYQLGHLVTSAAIPLGTTRYSVVQLALLLLLTVGLWFAISSLTKALKTYILSRTGTPTSTQEILTIGLRYGLMFLGILLLLQAWGIDIGSLTLLASGLGVGIGFGLQNLANNFISGLVITFEKPIEIGNFVRVGEWEGIVQRIAARHTEICTLDRVTIIIPNSRFLENEVINWSHGNPVSRLHLPVGVAYGSDVERVKGALLEAAKHHPEVLLRPRPQVWFQEFGDSSLNFELLVWTAEPREQPRIKSELNYRIEASLRRFGVQVPFPQRDVNFKSPQIDRALDVWLQREAPPALPDSNSDLPPTETPLPELDSYSAGLSAITSVVRQAPDIDLEALVREMRGSDGIVISDRRYRLNVYPRCFVGLEAVDWLVQNRNCTRAEAIEVGQMLLDRGIIHHVMDQHGFQDEYLFYRFYSDEQRI